MFKTLSVLRRIQLLQLSWGLEGGEEVELIDWDPDGERKMLVAMLYPYSHLPETQLVDVVDGLTMTSVWTLSGVTSVIELTGDTGPDGHLNALTIGSTFSVITAVLGIYNGTDFLLSNGSHLHRNMVMRYLRLCPVLASAIDTTG